MCKWTRVCIRPARLRPGFRRSLKSSVGPAVFMKPCIVVYLICRKSALQLLNTRRATFLCNYNTKPVRSVFRYFDWKSLMMEIAFSHITAKKFNINSFLTLVTGCRNHACCMADQIASKRQRRNQSCFGSVYFFVCLLNSFERVPARGVTEIPYLANSRTWGWQWWGRNILNINKVKWLKLLLNVFKILGNNKGFFQLFWTRIHNFASHPVSLKSVKK